MAESGDPLKVKVIDRRWFTAEGELREPVSGGAAAAPEPAPAAPPAAAPEPAPTAPPAAAPDRSLERHQPARQQESVTAPPTSEQPADGSALPAGPGLADIVDLLAQQAMAFLSGQVPGRGRDPATARYFIDLLGVLKEKTAGRLTLEETNFLDDVLYQLRSLFVAASR